MIEYEKINTLPQKYEYLAYVKTPVFDESGKNISCNCDYMFGGSCAPHHPPTSRIFMDPEWPGMRLGGVVGNTSSMLIVHTELKKIIEKYLKPQEQVEFLPIIIMNHKRRVASADYFVINPVGTLDCLHSKLSKVKRSKSGEVIWVHKMVLDQQKISWEPTIFRAKEAPNEYIINGKVTTEFKASGFQDRNVFVTAVEIA